MKIKVEMPVDGPAIRYEVSVRMGTSTESMGLAFVGSGTIRRKMTLDTSLHARCRAERMRDPEFRTAYVQATDDLLLEDPMDLDVLGDALLAVPEEDDVYPPGSGPYGC